MSDIIRLLPDNIANQIAAGEVIQRPASVVKELLENAIDAGAKHIQLLIKDAGKTSIQVIDDGKGMSETDARLSFERHATSKIRSANDLFNIKTMGFRGEALASIAAIAQVELLTRQHTEDVATRISIEGSKVGKQEKSQGPQGTSILVKNLFYNVPARRKFLKSDTVELKHIMDEFIRVALAFPEIHFTMYNNNNETYYLPTGNLKQRIVNLLGKNMNDKLIPIEEDTDMVKIRGFICKPETARRTKGDQYIFVNQRFIKNHYLSHAIRSAYEDLIATDCHPMYYLYLDIDPSTIDINVHPTKTEIKFEEERMLYNYLRVSIKHGLGKYSISPMIDFNTDSNIFSKLSNAKLQGDFENTNFQSKFDNNKTQLKNWQELYKGVSQFDNTTIPSNPESNIVEKELFAIAHEELNISNTIDTKTPFQINNQYILCQIKSGIMLLDQQATHERILYEEFLNSFQRANKFTQKELFPKMIELDASKAITFKNILNHLNQLGFEIEDFGKNTFIVHGTPSGMDTRVDINNLMEKVIFQFEQNIEVQIGIEENIARSMAVSSCIKKGKSLQKEEMNDLIDRLFACEQPYSSPSGHKCFIVLEHTELEKRFNA